MSRSTARFLNGCAQAATMLQSQARRRKTWAALIERLNDAGQVDVATNRGALKLLPLRGVHVQAALGWDREEPETLDWLASIREGETLWDVGAQIGFGALYAAKGGVKVLAFEPKASSFALLAEHAAINGLADLVTPLCVALSDETKLARLTVSTLGPGSWNNSLEGAPDQFGRPVEGWPQGVPALRGDDLVAVFGAALPDHIKIDVDGVEAAVLAGLGATLPKVRSVLIEVEGRNAEFAAERIEAPLAAAGLVEDLGVRKQGSRRNRLYRNPTRG